MADINEELKRANENVKHVLSNLSKYLDFGMLVCGETGTGKSTLVNSFFGTNICEVGDPGEFCGSESKPNDSFQPQTKEIKKIVRKLSIEGNTSITIWDTPGLQHNDAEDKACMEKIQKCIENVELVLYCIPMTMDRFVGPNERAIQCVAESVKGVDFWRKCILVLTKANLVHVNKENRCDPCKYFETRYKNFLDLFRQQLANVGVSADIYERIPAVAAGIVEEIENDDGHYDHKQEDYDDRFLFYITDELQNREKKDFLAELWMTCFKVLDDLGRIKLINITLQNIELTPQFHDELEKSVSVADYEKVVKTAYTVLKESANQKRMSSQLKSFQSDMDSIEHCSNLRQRFRLELYHLQSIKDSKTAWRFIHSINEALQRGNDHKERNIVAFATLNRMTTIERKLTDLTV